MDCERQITENQDSRVDFFYKNGTVVNETCRSN